VVRRVILGYEQERARVCVREREGGRESRAGEREIDRDIGIDREREREKGSERERDR